MKWPLAFACALCTAFGLLLGVLLPLDLTAPAGEPASPSPMLPLEPAGSGDGTGQAETALDPEDNFSLLHAAGLACGAIGRRDFAALASYVHPDRGVTFTPYSTVDFDTDLTFTAEQIRGLEQDPTTYVWGLEDGRGLPIQMTMVQYLDRYVWDADYTRAPEIGIDRIVTSGNALENLTEAYEGCRFVDFCHPSADPVNDGLDWSSLKLVFQAEGSRWYLVGIVHGEWTI